MESMILAAGLGTRLRPLTNDRPKALVEVGGVSMLERVAHRLVAAGTGRLVINVHHFAERVEAFVEERDGFGVEVCLSREAERALETGGGIQHARPCFRAEAPFIVHNVDVLTDLDLEALYQAHCASGALATLAVRPAQTQRYLVFDEADGLCGYGRREDGREVLVRPPEGATRHLDFCGVQVLSSRIFDLMTETGAFSIINVYMRLVQVGQRVRPFRADAARCLDIGTLERLEKAQRLVS